MADAYAGLLGAYVFALRRSPSWIFRSYVIVSAVVGLFTAVLLVLAVISWAASPVAFGERAFLGVIGILLLVPLATPVLVVARRRRRTDAVAAGDRWLGLAGYGFVVAIFIALFVSDPSTHAVGGPAAPVVAWLDGLPDRFGLVAPVVAALLIVLVVRLTRPAVRAHGTESA